MQDWITIAQQLGFPTAVLIAVGWGIWRCARWFATKIVEPLVPVVFAYVEAAKKSTELVESNAALLAELVRGQQRIESKLGEALPVHPGGQ